MLWRITVPLLAAAGLVFACSPRTPNPGANARAMVPRTVAGQGTAPGTKTARVESGADRGIVSHVMVDTADGTVSFAIEVTNATGKRVELNFPDGRTHEFVVLDTAGREVWRWSAGRLFTQAMQNRLLDAHDSAIYRERWLPNAPGQYTLVAQLRSENHPMQQRVDFALR